VGYIAVAAVQYGTRTIQSVGHSAKKEFFCIGEKRVGDAVCWTPNFLTFVNTTKLPFHRYMAAVRLILYLFGWRKALLPWYTVAGIKYIELLRLRPIFCPYAIGAVSTNVRKLRRVGSPILCFSCR